MSVRKNANFAILFPVVIFIYVIKWNSLPEWFLKFSLDQLMGFLLSLLCTEPDFDNHKIT